MKVVSVSLIGCVAFLVTLARSAAADGLPDILGIQLGMPVREAYAKLESELPKNVMQTQATTLPTIDKPVLASFFSAPKQQVMLGMESDRVTVDVTLPPNKQSVWRVDRLHTFADKGILGATLLAQLREKYGKETQALSEGLSPTTNDREVRVLWWLLDEQGRAANPATRTPSGANPSSGCKTDAAQAWANVVETPLNTYGNKDRLWCLSNDTEILITFSPGALPELYSQMHVAIVSLPMGSRAGAATAKWKQDAADAASKRDLDKAAQQQKPKL
jgi:hypothetical protein